MMDRGFTDFERLARLDEAEAWFVIRAKANLRFYVSASRPIDRATGLRCDQSIRLRGFYSKQRYPGSLRRVRSSNPRSELSLVFLTDHFGCCAHFRLPIVPLPLADRALLPRCDMKSLSQLFPMKPP